MMLPLPSRPFRQQLGLGQVRLDSLLRFIHVLMTDNRQEVQAKQLFFCNLTESDLRSDSPVV